MNKQELIDQIVEDVGISRGKASTAIDVIFESVADELRQRPVVKVGALGTFTAKKRSTRGIPIEISPDAKIVFLPSESTLPTTRTPSKTKITRGTKGGAKARAARAR